MGALPFMSETVASAFAAVAHTRGASLALGFEGVRMSYAEVERQAGRVAAGFRSLGLGRGDRIVIVARNRIEHALWLLACARLGALHTVVHPDWTSDELRRVFRDAEPAMVAVASDLCGSVLPAAAAAGVRHVLALDDPEAMRRFLCEGELEADTSVGPEEDGFLWYTSGTSGRPKGVIWTHRAFLFNALVINRAVGIGPQDVGLRVSPMAHNGVAGAVMGTLLRGAPVHLLSRWNAARVIDVIRTEGVTWTNFTPASARLLLDAARERGIDTLPSLRVVLVGAAPTPPDLLEQMTRFLPRAAIVHGCGATEGYMAVCRPGPVSRTDGSVGEALPETGLRIVGDDGTDLPPGAIGRVWMKSPGLMRGYWRDSEATAQAFQPGGWVDVGDLGRMDENGSLWLLGRRFDVINCGGYNVYATEVEAALDRLPGVRGSAVVGAPDPLLGERIVAFVEAAPGAALTVERLHEGCAALLAKYKRPAEIALVDALPRNGYGKVVKKDLNAAVN
jgi:acyl-CoA synthetase (AMP-forming)/AMP-acid ligase II